MAWTVHIMIYYTLVYFIALCDSAAVPGIQNDGKPDENMGDWLFTDSSKKTDWNKYAKDRLDYMLKNSPYTPTKAKNVILFIGDGLGPSTITASRFYSMQKYRKTLAMDYFPVSGQAKTYNVNLQTPDSAGTATAFLGGEKTKQRVLGLDQNIEVGKCVNTTQNRIEPILRRAIKQDKWTGVVTTARITHATPAAAYAFSAHRDWESDSERDKILMEDGQQGDDNLCPDIASQLVYDEINKKIRVILGGGRSQLYPINVTDPENPQISGKRADNQTLTDVWVDDKVNRIGITQDKVKYVWKKDDFDAVNPENVEYLMGLFEPSHMQYEADRKEDKAGEPSLADMVEKAVRILRRSEDGFFLLVEGGRIDHAHHANWAAKAMEDTVAMSEAIRRAQSLTDEQDTLLISSADHSHVFVINGYTYIDNDITGLAKFENGTNIPMDDNKPYTTVSYTSGPGFLAHRTKESPLNQSFIMELGQDEIHPRINLTGNADVGKKDFFYDAGMYRPSETHGGEDVGVYASGPMSHLLTGTYEQNYIAHVMMYAACIKPYENRPGCKMSTDIKKNVAVPGIQNDGKPDENMGDWLFTDGSKKIDWNKYAKDRLDYMLKDSPYIPTKAKNVILFIGDGLGPSTITASRFYSMQKYQKTLAMDYFPVSGLAKTYNVDSQTPDSAGTATAFLGGEKTKIGVLGLDQNIVPKKCVDITQNKIEPVLRRAVQQDKWTGVVTTTRITHATPAAAYAFSSHRDWESDSERDKLLMEDGQQGDDNLCPDIASQLVYDEINQKIRVILGGGRSQFYPINVTDPENPANSGKRADNQTLPDVWVNQKVNRMGVSRDKVKYVWKKDDFDAVKPENIEYLMGLFEPSHMQFEADRKEDKAGEPSLADMVEKAVRILRRSKDGFFLLVEAGRIDHAHHATWAAKAMEDTVALSEAIRRAQALTEEKDTLIVSSADHSHAFVINGYSYISDNITGLAKFENGTNIPMNDNKPYTTVSYTNGPGFLAYRTNESPFNSSFIKELGQDEIQARMNLTGNADVGKKDFFYDASMYRYSETHAGEDVGVYASGPMSHLLTGTYEQNYIAHVMMYAACIKPYQNRAGCKDVNTSEVANSANVYSSSAILLLLQLAQYTTYLLTT